MPLYVYQVIEADGSEGEVFEVLQSLDEPFLTQHPESGKPVRRLQLPRDAALVTILRGPRVIVPAPDEPLEGGDELLFVAVSEVEEELRQLLLPEHHPAPDASHVAQP